MLLYASYFLQSWGLGRTKYPKWLLDLMALGLKPATTHGTQTMRNKGWIIRVLAVRNLGKTHGFDPNPPGRVYETTIKKSISSRNPKGLEVTPAAEAFLTQKLASPRTNRRQRDRLWVPSGRVFFAFLQGKTRLWKGFYKEKTNQPVWAPVRAASHPSALWFHFTVIFHNLRCKN